MLDAASDAEPLPDVQVGINTRDPSQCDATFVAVLPHSRGGASLSVRATCVA